MTFRGTVVNGLIVPDPGIDLPDGTRVALNPLRGPRQSKATPPKSRRKPKTVRKRGVTRRTHPFAALAGIWRDRPEWRGKSSVEVVAELRRRSPGKRRG